MTIKVGKTWELALKEEFSKPYFRKLINYIDHEYKTKKHKIFPSEDQIFRALEICPLDKIKIVIIGQDPYPTKGHAHGLCFSVQENLRPLPKSLINIYKEIETDIGKKASLSGDLVHWAEQGVLLLNTVLTVEESKPESHLNKGWEQFTDAIISLINERTEGVVYLLWGTKAQQKVSMVDPMKNLILRTSHPSPLSSYRGFIGCKHFSKANNYLMKHGKSPINW